MLAAVVDQDRDRTSALLSIALNGNVPLAVER
jgi:hypothetical protein